MRWKGKFNLESTEKKILMTLVKKQGTGRGKCGEEKLTSGFLLIFFFTFRGLRSTRIDEA